jgi:prepilin-type N-terminal cleavage/methylation domain-containing protein/prepilin-type processing-associated H-X9-DG protein
MNSRRAFTLIELLVVIAIIAILAAILFPVFAQAKLAAKKTAALSNSKNIGTAMHIYLADADDTTPSVYSVNGRSADVYQLMQPYVKNMTIFFSDEWRLQNGASVGGTSTASCDNRASNTIPGYYVPSGEDQTRCVSFGYNWGFGIWAGGGLTGAQYNWDGATTPTASSPNTVLPGISATAVENPARMAAFGDTYNGRRYTMSAIGSILTYYMGPARNNSLRYGGSFNFAFVDGHAKSMKMQGYTYNPTTAVKGEGYIGVPADTSAIIPMYCSMTDVTVKPSALGVPAPDMPCGQFINLALSGALSGGYMFKWPN